MPIDKVLQKIQSDIHDLTPTLELFVDETIQPSAGDCERLQQQLVSLQENLAVYKYSKQDRELSPSFNIHAKVSEKEPATEIIAEEKPQAKIEPAPEKNVEPIEIKKTEASKAASSLSFGINDKFRFINELFVRNNDEYNIVIGELGKLRSWNEAEIYLNNLKNLYEWKESNEVVKYFYSLIKKHFS